MNLYRIYPVLWNEGNCQMAQNVYAIDREPPPNTFPTCCSSRVKEDPAYYWEGSTFKRLLPLSPSSGCYQPPVFNSVRWSCIPGWLSQIRTFGYTYQGDISNLTPNREFYIQGP